MGIEAVESDEVLARRRRVALCREKWKADRDAGRLPPPKLRPPPQAHPTDDFLTRGIPPGCVGQFEWPQLLPRTSSNPNSKAKLQPDSRVSELDGNACAAEHCSQPNGWTPEERGLAIAAALEASSASSPWVAELTAVPRTSQAAEITIAEAAARDVNVLGTTISEATTTSLHSDMCCPDRSTSNDNCTSKDSGHKRINSTGFEDRKELRNGTLDEVEATFEAPRATWFEHYARRGLPCLVSGCTAGWVREAWTPNALAEAYGDAPWSVRGPLVGAKPSLDAEAQIGEDRNAAAVPEASNAGEGINDQREENGPHSCEGKYASLESNVTTLRDYLEACRAAVANATKAAAALTEDECGIRQATAASATTAPESALSATDTTALGTPPSLQLPYGANNCLAPELAANFALPLPFPTTSSSHAADGAAPASPRPRGVRLEGAYPSHACRLAHTRLWVGPAGSPGVHWHRDLQDNFIVGLFGGKRVWVAPPHATLPCFGGAVTVTPYLQEAVHGAPCLPPPSRRSPIPPEAKQLPLPLSPLQENTLHKSISDGTSQSRSSSSSEARVLEAVDVHVGDCLYVPAGWWHSTENLPADISDDASSHRHDNDDAAPVVGTLNFFMPSCYAALGVVVPDLMVSSGGGWLPGFEPCGVSVT